MAAKDIYASTAGSSGNSGFDPAHPKDTIAHAMALAVAGNGDTIHIMTNFAEGIDGNVMTIPQGTSWSNNLTIQGYQGVQYTITKGSNSHALNFTDNNGPIKYVKVKDLVIDGTGTDDCVGGNGDVGHVWLEHLEIKNASNQGVHFPGDDHKIMNCNIHDNGDDNQLDHGIYMAGDNMTIDGNTVHNNCAGGLQAYPSAASTWTISNNQFYSNGSFGLTVTGNDHKIYNNLVYNNGTTNPEGGLQLGTSGAPATSCEVYNNSVYNDASYGIYVVGTALNCKLRNNISWGNAGSNTDFYIEAGASGTYYSHNLTQDPINDHGTNSHNEGNNITPATIPYTNAGSAVFTLTTGTAAIDGGTNTGIDSIFLTDILAATRPAGAAWDIGAYESGGSVPAAQDGYFSKIYFKSFGATADYTSIITPTVHNTSGTGAGRSHYGVALYKYLGTFYVNIYSCVNGDIGIQLPSDTSTTWVAGDALSLEVTGSSTFTIVAKQNDVQIGSQSTTDSTLASTGGFGFGIDGTNDAVIEGWEAGTITAGVRAITASSTFSTGTGTLGSVANNDGWEQQNLSAATITYTNGAVTSSPRSSNGFDFAVARWVGITPPSSQVTRYLFVKLV